MTWTNTDMAYAVVAGWGFGAVTVALFVAGTCLKTSNRKMDAELTRLVAGITPANQHPEI